MQQRRSKGWGDSRNNSRNQRITSGRYEPKMDVQIKTIVGRVSKKQRTAIHAWRTSKRFGLVVCDAVSTKLVKTSDGVEYMGFVCKIKTDFTVSIVSGLYNESKQILWIPDLKLVISPRDRYFKKIAPKK